MKKLLHIIIYVIIGIVLITCILGALFYPPMRMQLIMAALSIVAGIAIINGIRKFILRRKEKAFIQRVITSDKKATRQAPLAHQKELLALEQSWYEAVEKLRTSKLRTSGNPLYALPWYMVIGESGTGKTSMLKHSGLSSPLSKLNSSPGLAMTKNCDWWFFNEAIMLDTAGRYTIPLDQEIDVSEWDEFLKLLAKFRKKEPINGIVAAISANKLMEMSSEKLAEQGLLVRSRIDQVMHVLGSSFPVYIMVTKMDLVFGMPEFFRALPRSRLGSAMGWCNNTRVSFSEQLLDTAITSVCDNLKQLQFRLLHNEKMPEAEVLIFPQRFMEISKGLHSFCNSLFVDSVYHVSPSFRGLYFSSSLQKVEGGEDDSDVGSSASEVLSGGLFLKDFFSAILPGDRKLHWRIPEYAKKNFLRRMIIIGTWAGLWACLAILIMTGYSRNASTLKSVTPPLPIANEVNINSIENIRTTIIELDQKNKDVFPLCMGMKQSANTAKQLRAYFLTTFESNILRTSTLSAQKSIEQLSIDTPEEPVMNAISYLTSLLGICTRKSVTETEFQEFVRVSANYLPTIEPVSRRDASLFARQLCDWIKWSEEENVNTLCQQLYNQLALLFEKKGPDLQWCSRFALHGVEDIEISRFWPYAETRSVPVVKEAKVTKDNVIIRSLPAIGTDKISQASLGDHFQVDSTGNGWTRVMLQSGNSGWVSTEMLDFDEIIDTIKVNGAFTREGFSNIQTFLSHIDSAITDTTSLALFRSRQQNFNLWYWDQYFLQWNRMTGYFASEVNSTASIRYPVIFAQQVASGEDPFIRYLREMANELDSLDKKIMRPSWCDQVVVLRDLEQYVIEKQKRDSTKTTIGKTKNKITGFFQKFNKQVQEITNEDKVLRMQRIEASAKTWTIYRKSLVNLADFTQRPKGLLQYARGLFDVQDSCAALYNNYRNASNGLKKRLFDKSADESVWSIIDGPADILQKAAYNAARYELERLWSQIVLARSFQVASDNQAELLFAPDSGLVRKFLADHFVSAFLMTGSDGIVHPVEGIDGPLSFIEDFITFVNKGLMYQSKEMYTITLKTVPFTVNSDASEEPYETILRVQCAEGANVLENYNQYESADFIYRPSSCGEVSLKIIFPSYSITKTWNGRWGFPTFLSAINDGTFIFKPEDFDQQYQIKMAKKSCKWIRVTYTFDPNQASVIAGLLNNIPGEIPTSVTVPIQ